MEQEANILHLLEAHQIALFLVGSTIVIAGVLFVGYMIGKWAEKRRQKEDGRTRD